VRRIDPGDLLDLGALVENAGGDGARAAEPLLLDLDGLDVDETADLARRLPRALPLTIGVARDPVSPGLAPLLERLTLTLAPDGPGRAWVAADGDALDEIAATVGAAPVAAQVLVRVLAAGDDVPVVPAIELESAAYSTLLASGEFRRWRDDHPASPALHSADPPVLLDRDGPTLVITLNRHERHNAFSTAMRDALLEALLVPALDPTIETVELRGAGASFCSGGDLAEFGTAGDPALAHLVRTQQSVGAAVHALRDRVSPVLHGACVGAGIEIPAFAGHVRARDDAWFRLPELPMGLIPGAGGTVSIPRRIGRWRTAFLALTGRRIEVATALEWGLVDELV
jgi:hypothetical protein